MLLAVLLLCAFLAAPVYIIYKQPAFFIRWCERRWPDVLWRVKTTEKVIALTIDDGPSEHTRELLEVLQANGASATFFIIGSHVARHKGILEEIIHAGSELANHAVYDEPSRNLLDTELRSQIEVVDEIIDNAYKSCNRQKPPKYFRPGSGFFSARMRRLVAEVGYRLVLGNVYPHDAQVPFWRVNAWHVLSMLQPGGIVICHDGRKWTVPMLKEVLPEMKKRGFKVVTVTELLEQ